MASGDRLRIADKPTLDLTYAAVLNIESNLTDVQSTTTQILSAVLDANTTFIASDSVLKTLVSSEKSVSSGTGGTIVLGTFTPKYDGTLRLKVRVRTDYNTAGSAYAKISVTANSKETNYNIPERGSTAYIDQYFDISVTKKVVYTLKLKQDYMANISYCNYAVVCGSVQTASSSLV